MWASYIQLWSWYTWFISEYAFLPKYDSMGHKVQYHVIQDLGKLLIAGIYDWQYVRNAGKSKESMKSCFLDWLN